MSDPRDETILNLLSGLNIAQEEILWWQEKYPNEERPEHVMGIIDAIVSKAFTDHKELIDAETRKPRDAQAREH